MDDYDLIDKVLHLPFDIQLHKDTFDNYLEVIIYDDGKIEYAIPSHQERLIAICQKQLGVTRQQLSDMCPREQWLDYRGWLCKKCKCIAVYNDRYIGTIWTTKQAAALAQLKSEGLYTGKEVNMRDINNYIEYIKFLELDEPWYILSDRQIFKVYCLSVMLEYNYTLRKAASELLVPKSTLHNWIHHDIRHISITMYDELLAMMQGHRNKRKGGK